MNRQRKRWDHGQQMPGTSQAMEQAKARCRMRMAAMVALPAKMQMEMAMQGRTIVVMVMGMQLQAKRGSNGESANHKQRHPHQKFSPCRHAFGVDQIFKKDRNNTEQDHPKRVAAAPSHSRLHGLQRSP